MVTYTPKGISQHPAVEWVVPGEEQGSDYRYFVCLKIGWRFTQGSKQGGTGGGFNTVQQFHYAAPKLIPKEEK